MSAPPMLPPITPAVLNNGLGARFLGCLINLMLQGFVVSQIWQYFTVFGGSKRANTNATIDPVWLQVMVGIVLVATTFQCAILTFTLYDVHVLHFANPEWIFKFHWGMLVAHISTVIIAVVTQAYFARRCFLLIGKPKLFPFFLLPLLAFCLADGIAFAAIFLSMTDASLQTHASILQGIMGSWLTVSVVIDLAITGIMVHHLRKIRDETSSFKSTMNGLNKMISYALNTCAISTLLILASFILYFVLPVTSAWYCLTYEPISKIYASSLLAALMTRKSLGGAMRSPASSDGLRTTSLRKPVKPVFAFTNETCSGSSSDRKNSVTSRMDDKRAFPMSDFNSSLSSAHTLPFEKNLVDNNGDSRGVRMTKDVETSENWNHNQNV